MLRRFRVWGRCHVQGTRFPLRAYGGTWTRELRFGRLTHARVLGIVSNPASFGADLNGRYYSTRTVSPEGRISTKVVELLREKWPIVIFDHHLAYLTWDDYLANAARLAANKTNAGAR